MTTQSVQHNLEYNFVTPNEIPDFLESAINVFKKAYPKFLTHDIWTDSDSLALFETYPEFQFGLVEVTTQRVIAQGNCLPLMWEGCFDALPEGGCDWALVKGFADREQKRKPNVLCAVSISILPEYQGKNLSPYMIEYMKELAKSHSLSALIMAARPSLKSLYPLIPIERYITWRDENRLIFDSWLRVNVKQGAQIAGICFKSTTIIDTIVGWENRVGMRFPETGDYIIAKGLVPIKIDYSHNIGVYIEPNVWLYYNLYSE